MEEILIIPCPSVKELMNELLNMNIIPQKDLMALKKDNVEFLNPNLVMEMRHNELKERRKRNIKQRNDKEEPVEDKSYKATHGNDNIQETLIIEEELKKYQKHLDIEKRKMNQLVRDVKISGKEVKNKSKKILLKKEKKSEMKRDDENEKISSNASKASSENGCDEEIKTKRKSTKINKNNLILNPENCSTDYEKEINNLSNIKKFLDSLDNLEQEIPENCDKVQNVQSNDLEHLFEEMEKLDKSFDKIYNEVANPTVSSTQEPKIDKTKQVNNQLNNKSQRIKNDKTINHLIVNLKNKEDGSNEVTENSNCDIESLDDFKEMQNIPTGSKMQFADGYKENSRTVVQKYNAAEFTEIKGSNKEKSLLKTDIYSSSIILINDDDDVITAKDGFDKELSKNKIEEFQLHFYNKREQYLAQKFFIKWRNNTKPKIDKTTEEKFFSNFRNAVESKFDTFISKLHKQMNQRKVKDTKNEKQLDEKHDKVISKDELKSISYGEKFRNRYKAQKGIIEKQREILEEQRRKIEELEKDENKLKNYKVETKKMNTNDEVNDDKIKIDKKKTNDKDLKLYDPPKFLENMNKRVQERKEKREKLKELKLKKEEEKLKLKLLEEEQQKKKREEKKYAEIQAEQMQYLKKILQEENRKIETKNIEEAERKLSKMNRELLLTNYMKLWKNAMTERNENKEIIKQIFERSLKVKVMESLKYYTELRKKKKYKMAKLFRRNKLQKKYWKMWFNKWKEQKQMQQVAEDYNDLRLGKRVLIALMWNRQQNHRKQDELMLEAVSYHTKKLLWKGFQSLKCYPQLLFEERERDKRLRSWEEKVKEILPDFSIT